jgi:hypothetical protein
MMGGEKRLDCRRCKGKGKARKERQGKGGNEGVVQSSAGEEQSSVVQCSVVQYSTVQYSTYSTVQCRVSP